MFPIALIVGVKTTKLYKSAISLHCIFRIVLLFYNRKQLEIFALLFYFLWKIKHFSFPPLFCQEWRKTCIYRLLKTGCINILILPFANPDKTSDKCINTKKDHCDGSRLLLQPKQNFPTSTVCPGCFALPECVRETDQKYSAVLITSPTNPGPEPGKNAGAGQRIPVLVAENILGIFKHSLNSSLSGSCKLTGLIRTCG